MLMPEASIHENHCFVFRQNDIGAARKCFDVFPIPESLRKEILSNQFLRSCVLASNMGHIHAADFFAVVISHCPHLLRDSYSRF